MYPFQHITVYFTQLLELIIDLMLYFTRLIMIDYIFRSFFKTFFTIFFHLRNLVLLVYLICIVLIHSFRDCAAVTGWSLSLQG